MEALASTFPTPLAITPFYPSSGAILNGSSKEEAVRLQCSVCEEGQPAGCTPSVKMTVVKSALFFCGRLHLAPLLHTFQYMFKENGEQEQANEDCAEVAQIQVGSKLE